MIFCLGKPRFFHFKRKEMVQQAKIFAVEDIKSKIASAKTVALIDYQGLTAPQLNELRDKIRQVGGSLEVFKNTLIIRALAGLSIELPELLTGPTAVVFSNEDEVSGLKKVEEARKQFEKPEFKYGVYQNKLLGPEEVLKFVALPAREVLLAQFVGGLANPLARLIASLKYNQTRLLLVLKAAAAKTEN